jgi:hypothetical protein
MKQLQVREIIQAADPSHWTSFISLLAFFHILRAGAVIRHAGSSLSRCSHDSLHRIGKGAQAEGADEDDECG